MNRSLILVTFCLLTLILTTSCELSVEVEDEDYVDSDWHTDGEPYPSDGDEPRDGDFDLTDGEYDPGDGDEVSDGDDTVGCDDHLACESNEDCNEGCGCHDALKTCQECECEDCYDWYGQGCWECYDDCFCGLRTCRTDADCCPGTFCLGGICQGRPHCEGDSIVMNVPTTCIKEGETVDLSVILLNVHGAKIPLFSDSTNFDWTIDNENIGTIAEDAADDSMATLTGGSIIGTVTVTATLTCNNTITATAVFTNYTKIEKGSRIVVYDSGTGTPLEGVPVYLNFQMATSGPDGAAFFGSVNCKAETPCELHVLPATHTYVSAVGLAINDILIPVAANIDEAIAGGVRGHQDPSAIPEMLQGDVRIGFTSFAIPGNLTDLNFESLMGTMLNTHIQIGATIDENILLPTGVEGYLNETTPLKDGYAAQGMGGSGTLWGMGGYAQLTDILEMVTGALGGEIEIAHIVGAIIPLFRNFYHGVQPGLEFAEIAKVPDLDDINNNDDVDEMIPDFDDFLDLAETFALTQEQTQVASMSLPSLPTGADAILSLVGAMESGEGFIPLGIDAALDDQDGVLDGEVGWNNNGLIPEVYFAPQHSGVSGYDYYVLSIALNLAGLLDKTAAIDLSASVYKEAASPSDFTMPEFMAYMSDATWADHTIDAIAIPGASFHRLVLQKSKDYHPAEQRFWQIYWPGNQDDVTFSHLPPLDDDRGVDLGAMSNFQAVNLVEVSYDELFAFNGTNINDMNSVIESFSMHFLGEQTERCE